MNPLSTLIASLSVLSPSAPSVARQMQVGDFVDYQRIFVADETRFGSDLCYQHVFTAAGEFVSTEVVHDLTHNPEGQNAPLCKGIEVNMENHLRYIVTVDANKLTCTLFDLSKPAKPGKSVWPFYCDL